jgi:2-dehydro-3-deoxygluconokinase
VTGPRVWTVGEALAVYVPAVVGPADQADTIRVSTGGAELNTAIGLARLGHDVTYLGVVGNDPWGRKIQRALRAESVTALLRTEPDHFTGAYLRERRTAALIRASYFRRGSAGSQLTVHDVDQLNPSPGDIVHLTGVTPALSTTAREAWLTAAQRSHEAGAIVSLDVNYRSALWSQDDAKKAFGSVVASIDVVFAGVDEAALVTGKPVVTPEDAAASVHQLLSGSAELVIKNGAAGSLHLGPDGSTTEGRALVVQTQDIVGAGDAFAAGYLSGQIDALPTADRLARAHACAAFVVATDGDWEGAPSRGDLGAVHRLLDADVTR